MKAFALMLLIACTVLGTSGCGGGDDAAPEDESADLVAQVDGVCEEWRLALDARGDFPVEGFDPERPSPDELPAVGEYFATANAATEEALGALRGLDSPAALRSKFDTLTAAVADMQAHATRQVAAARSGDVAGFTASLPGAAATTKTANDAADALGASSCAF